MRPRYLTDDNGKKISVVLPIEEYRKMIEDLEELEDIRLYDTAKSSDSVPMLAEEAFKLVEARRKKKA